MSFARRRTPVGALHAFSGILGGLVLASPYQLRAAEHASPAHVSPSDASDMHGATQASRPTRDDKPKSSGAIRTSSPNREAVGEAGGATRTSRSNQSTPLSALLRLFAFQLVPSPTLTIGTDGGVKAGARWQLTPLVYSFGITEQPARFFLVAPVARHVGAIESYLSPEWSCCVRSESGWLARAGLRVYWPVIGWGESLAMSLGGSYYYENHRQGGSAELGFYTFASMLGVTITGSPWLIGREMMLTLSLRYF